MTPTIRQELRSDGRGIAWLAEQWGLWARGGGIQGYPQPLAPPSVGEPLLIDEATAGELEKAMCAVRRQRPRLFFLLRQYYVGGFDFGDIASLLSPQEIAMLERHGKRGQRDLLSYVLELGLEFFRRALEDAEFRA